jgi:hypothetical protein
MECGHEFRTDISDEHCTCPACRKQLKIEHTRKNTLERRAYFSLVQAKNGIQVVRFVRIEAKNKIGEEPQVLCHEVAQQWIGERGETASASLLRRPLSWYVDEFCYTSEIAIRKSVPALPYMDGCPVYPRMSIIPALQRNGIGKDIHDNDQAALFEAILREPRIETMWKAEQYPLVCHFVRYQSRLHDYWPAIKIAIRNHYFVEEASLWKDYIEALICLGKDIHNAKYVCPADLREAHDQAISLKLKKEKEERALSERQRAIKDEKRFKALKSRFFGIKFGDGLISVHVLESVDEYAEEGAHMHHCVFANKYYNKPDSLILSATIDGKRVETIEVSLNTLKILQCYGKCNKFTEYHERIKNLVSRNTHLIRERLRKAC